ncbi:hypothetical protein KUTeg_006471 [Tegillarca granosa]|uniref:Uncharacterized protein n=1 Tax=Tegillarca granosa TaxID=220873 RepID=A0ABQ9FIR6_TEGGR|nr:hypothetical protein KUTeg_006471 [Tegillarca granosa]
MKPSQYPLLNTETDEDIRIEINVAKNSSELTSDTGIVKSLKKFSELNKIPYDSHIVQKSPYLDQHGLLRVGGIMNKLKRQCKQKHNSYHNSWKKSHWNPFDSSFSQQDISSRAQSNRRLIKRSSFLLAGGRRAIASCIHS